MNGRGAARLLLSLLMALWAGAIIGLSFIATPVKFQAPHLTMPVALEIGRYTFRLFSNVELGFLIAIVIAAVFARPRRATIVMLAIVAVQLLLERWWLLPELDARVSQILAGGAVTLTSSHWIYAVFDGLKAALLIGCAASAGRKPGGRSEASPC
ncbi:MAG TPA: DUF4149 domain-containing protein [Bryobacteraceae bacterium]|nr:DUF4149 domain-containing protein [Bryobacteraceae bacterium]